MPHHNILKDNRDIFLTKTNIKFIFFIVSVFVIILLGFLPGFLNSAPSNFPINTEISVVKGSSQTEIAQLLQEAGVVRSSTYLSILLKNNHSDQFIKAGIYRFSEPHDSHEVAQALTNGDFLTPHTKITFPEGFSTKNFLTFLPSTYSLNEQLDIREFEGYLFPDTYFISGDMSLNEIVEVMKSNFETKISRYHSDIERSLFTLDEIVVLASIIEREAGDFESKKLISGILQNRLNINMPLQVDATFDYLFDKESKDLTIDDLNYDSPYNTYLYLGLPPHPISNPGLDSIDAVLNPTETEYLYYLTAPDGTFYYSKTFEEHKLNKQKYLR